MKYLRDTAKLVDEAYISSWGLKCWDRELQSCREDWWRCENVRTLDLLEASGSSSAVHVNVTRIKVGLWMRPRRTSNPSLPSFTSPGHLPFQQVHSAGWQGVSSTCSIHTARPRTQTGFSFHHPLKHGRLHTSSSRFHPSPTLGPPSSGIYEHAIWGKHFLNGENPYTITLLASFITNAHRSNAITQYGKAAPLALSFLLLQWVISGIHVAEAHHKMPLYADDVLFYV